MKLSGSQVKLIQDALLSAYSKNAHLARMVRVELNENLNRITSESNDMGTVVFELIGWAESSGQIEKLIRGAYNDVPCNQDIQNLVAQMSGRGLSTESESPISSHIKSFLSRLDQHYGQVTGLILLLVVTGFLLFFIGDPSRIVEYIRIIGSPKGGEVVVAPLSTPEITETSPPEASQAPPTETLTPEDISTFTATATPEDTAMSIPQSTPANTPTNVPTDTPTSTPTNTPEQVPHIWMGFVSRHEIGNTPGVHAINTRSGEVRMLINGFDPAWSPLGDKIAFGSGTGVLTIVDGCLDVNSSNAQVLTSQLDWQPSWSPDGSQIVFMSERRGNKLLYKMNADGTSQAPLTNHDSDDRHPSWSPDGSSIAFISKRSGRWEIWMMSPDGLDAKQITDADLANDDYNYYKPTWSPDSRKLAFGVWTGVRNEIWIMNLNNRVIDKLVTKWVAKQEGEGYGLSWSSSNWIAYVSNKHGDLNLQIYAIRPDTKVSRRVTNSTTKDFFPAWIENCP